MTHYLDYAATSAIRPPEVTQAVADFLTDCGASPGRGGHDLALDSARMAFRCRRALTRVLGVTGDPGRIAFMFNATHALNTAMWGTVGEGDVIVNTVFDHNASLRPAHQLSKARGVEVRMIPGDASGDLDMDAAERMLDGARLLVINAVSNVLGSALPVRDLTRLAHDAGALVLVDAAQSAGHLTVSYGDDGVDMVAFTGHKALLAPPGTGGLWVREGLEVAPFLTGGTGGDSAQREMPHEMPDSLEAGTSNSAGVAGLLAGCKYLFEHGIDEIHEREMVLKAALFDALSATPGVRVVSPRAPEGVAIVTVTVDGTDASMVAERLNTEFGVMARHGLHCAPEAHRVLGTMAGGAVRLSIGWATTEDDVARAVEGLEEIARTPDRSG